ncbi:hypothetical protein [Streptomyces sp. CBMA152]|uniref:hypothetical protein n=1 Tax=Streptomyces sp. CBMA152 TaxID=1896312 RepID=UPI001660102B|nr:hypothetical protein [Streptomyces sp. CBMA152]MBD0741998.1 hypothetical protein [Streptomyces sp. CBMA152]
MSVGDEHDSRRTEDPYNDPYSTVGGTRQTRTRLPEGEGADVYGGARRPVRASRSLITVVGVVALLVAAIAFANRGDGGSGGSSGDPKQSGAQPTSATGTKPVEGKTGGIASGFPQTEQGAQSAAANYVVALGSDGMYNTARRHAIVNTVYAPDVAAARQGDLDKAYSGAEFLTRIGLKPDGSAPAGQTFISRFNPVGAKVEKFANDTASVSVWYSALFGLAGEGSKNPVSEGWYTNTFQLKWVGGDWKVTDFTQKDGPAPVGRDQAAATAKDMADAVEQYGGFTYAR